MEKHRLDEKIEMIFKKQYSKDNKPNLSAYICSPLRAKRAEDVLLNMRAAKAYMYYAAVKIGLYARAPHAFLPMLLCDMIPTERKTALQFGMELLTRANSVLVCGNRISAGMRSEIAGAAILNLKIYIFEKGIYDEVKKIVVGQRGNIGRIFLDENNPFMALSGSDIFENDWDWDAGGEI